MKPKPTMLRRRLYVSLHTSNPDAGESPTASEVNFPNYVRVPVAPKHWAVSGEAPTDTATNTVEIRFPEMGGSLGSPVKLTHFGLGTSSSGPGKLLFVGQLIPSISVSLCITVSFAPGDMKLQ